MLRSRAGPGVKPVIRLRHQTNICVNVLILFSKHLHISVIRVNAKINTVDI